MKVATLPLALALAACMTLTPADARHVTYECDGGREMTVVYAGKVARIENPGGPRIDLQRMERDTGVLYTSFNHKIRGEGDEITHQIGRAEPVACHAKAPAPT